MNKSLAKNILRGIVDAARARSKTPQQLSIKAGGRMLSRGEIDWYVNVQNVAQEKRIRKSTKQAKDLGLISTSFTIFQSADSHPMKLVVTEWDAKTDFKKPPRTIFEADATDAGARLRVIDMMVERLQQAGQAPE